MKTKSKQRIQQPWKVQQSWKICWVWYCLLSAYGFCLWKHERRTVNSEIIYGMSKLFKNNEKCVIWHTGKVGPGTHSWNPGPGTLHLRPFTWDPGLIGLTRDPGPRIWDPSPRTHLWDPVQGTNTRNQSKKTHFVYQSTVFCLVLILIYSLELSSQFLIIAKWFQINTCLFSVLNYLMLKIQLILRRENK